MERYIYLKMQPLEQARKIFLSYFDWLALVGSETIPTVEALGRVTSQPIFATLSSPNYHAAAMDGVALKAELTFSATDEHPLLLKLDQEAYYINTGQPLPDGTDAVVMIEQIHNLNEGIIELRAATFPWQHVRKIGEDIIACEMLLPHHQLLRAADLASLLTAGVFKVEVLKRPRVAIIVTGTELLNWHEAEKNIPKPGEIIETNSTFLTSLVIEYGGIVSTLSRQLDQYKAIRSAVVNALDSDIHMIILNAGVSAGSMDYTVRVLKDLGKILVHGVTIMPGKPSILGEVEGKPIVGTPGYPISAWVCADQFIRPALFYMQGQEAPQRENITAFAARRFVSKLGQEEFLRVHLGQVGGKVIATPCKRAASSITSLTRADGILRISAESDGIEEGSKIQVELLKPAKIIDETLLVVGSHDITIDLLGDYIKHKNSRICMTSSNVGSLGGLMAIKNGYSHLGGTHLLDTVTGVYNISYIQKYLPDLPVMLINLAWRMQGLLVKKGNPKGIYTLSDLTRLDVNFINRQAGSGTRVLLDYYLQNEGLNPQQIRGYMNEEYTHTAVAAQVLSGGVDCGLGIQAAAQALNLHFVPLCRERYDLCIPLAYQNDYRIIVLLQVLNDSEFRSEVEKLGGYDVESMGKVIWCSNSSAINFK